MQTILSGITYNGQPVYRSWTNGKKKVAVWLSREIKNLPDGSWKFVRYITLRELKLDRRRAWPKLKEAIDRAQAELLKMPGIVYKKVGQPNSRNLSGR